MSKCGKNNYGTRKLAKQAMKRRNRQIPEGETRVMNFYYCDHCSAWHLTSMTEEKFKRVTAPGYKPKSK